ncbi:LOB domain-containing protein 22 [Camellia lanceoleosa]|uniref:LOB domain-containing protein 22 n=1 Tax=Camellia lanceoleosa TaxID=1840588 RepID=A0ACC0FIS1_9ERIC|nr:LOB domain-containing protein 22 [Camellia lanceoleosa]
MRNTINHNSNINANTNTNINDTPTNTSTRVGPGGSTTGSQACAACKYQRRKCAPNCPLAPYFPAHQHKQFLNAHKLFGVGNIMKVLKNIQPCDQETAMKSIIAHSNLRAIDPVGGCYRRICQLQKHIEQYEAELELVHQHLNMCRAAQEQENPNVDSFSGYDAICNQMMGSHRRSDCDRGIEDDELVFFDEDWYNMLGFDVARQCAIKVDVEASCSSMGVHGKQVFVNESEAIKPLLGIFDEKQPIVPFESKESIEYRELKEEVDSSVQLKQEHDLKGNAYLFSLTNSND